MADGNTQQKRYWAELTQLRGHVIYLNGYRVESELWERRVNFGIAAVSSTSLAIWAVSQSVPWLWALLIAATQVFNSVKHYLPFEQRIEGIGRLNGELSNIALYAERKWYAVSEGELTGEEIHSLTFDIRRRKQEAEEEHLTRPLPDIPELRERAEQEAKRYFETFYKTGSMP